MNDVEPTQAHFSPELLLAQVQATFDEAPDPRLREIMQAAVRHLHAFALEVGLQTEERRFATRFLTAVGQISTDVRQEAELLSDVLGLSSLVETTSTPGGATIQTLTGPFYATGSPHRQFGDSMVERDDGDDPAMLRGRVTDPEGQPVQGAILDVWQNASNRFYAIQDPDQPEFNLRGKFTTNDDGRYEIRTIKPVPYTIPDDGPVGDLLNATGRHPWRAAHIHLLITHPDFRPLTTEIFDSESAYLESDAVFGVAPELILTFAPDVAGVLVATFDVTLSPADESGSGPQPTYEQGS